MDEKDKKEVLTKYRCKHDANRTSVSGAVMCFVMALLLALLVWLAWCYYASSDMFHKWYYIAVLGVGSVVLAISGFEIIQNYIECEKYLFCIIEEKVESTRVVRQRSGRHCYIDYRITFSTCQEYTLPDKCYTWSELSGISNEEMHRMTGIGDEFYVVVKRKRNKKGQRIPLAAYNKKFFEISEKSFEKRDGLWYVKSDNEKLN